MKLKSISKCIDTISNFQEKSVKFHRIFSCDDRLLAFPCLLYYFYRNVQWGRWSA